MGCVFGVCVEKNVETHVVARNYKFRVVFQGNRVVDHNYDAAIFQAFGSAPVVLEASRVAG
eukprot:6001894-Lingulodinium_polyedra.AAC.1